MTPSVAAFPGLSQLLAWPTGHLTEAADHWEAVGGRSYVVAHQVWRDALSIDWRGAAADAVRATSHADMLTTSVVADQLHAAAGVARGGASDLYAARSRARYAVEDARAAGFTVGEDLSITERVGGVRRASRDAEARAFAGDIRRRAEQLVELDRRVAQKVTAAVGGIRNTFPGSPGPPLGNRVHAVDRHIVKQGPPSAPYPVNEVVAEATDLDGNRVVLRRGYYDERTQQGFGWDKAYWRHHVINPNVFTDLISHSRPKNSRDGTLVYEIPINRVHCSQGWLGFADCEDTGESVTMRIVANVNEGRFGIPGGGQKGVISMYPLAGGSGVVEVEKDWTLCPPWVNKNVPIN